LHHLTLECTIVSACINFCVDYIFLSEKWLDIVGCMILYPPCGLCWLFTPCTGRSRFMPGVRSWKSGTNRTQNSHLQPCISWRL